MLFFFEHGLPLFIASIENGNINVYDIVAQLQAAPKYIKRFLDWMRNASASDGVVRALKGPYAPKHINQRERNQLLIAVYTIARIEGWPSVTNTMPQILPDQNDYNDVIRESDNMLVKLLKKASGYGNYYLVKYFITLGNVNCAADNNAAIQYASMNGHLAVVQYLMTLCHLGVDPTVSNNDAIQLASEYGHLAVVKYLMTFRDLGVDPAAGNNYAIRCASENGHLAVVQYLMTFRDLGVDLAVWDNYVIRCASENGHLAVVKQLLTSPRVNISKQQAQKMWDEAQTDEIKLFWKAYITQLEVREQGMERPTKLNK